MLVVLLLIMMIPFRYHLISATAVSAFEPIEIAFVFFEM